jgi:16S rRNA (adenine1518-N6/adenine1519-N6)-dimethyltransferase
MALESPPRQTLSHLRNLLAAHGIHPKNKLGQNFLIDLNLLDLIVRSAELSKDDLVVEIGSGTGSLTARLAEQAGMVFSVEIDPDFYALARETVAGRPNVVLFGGDVLKNKNHLNPGMLQKLAELRQTEATPILKMVANLPYAVATPVLSNFLLSEFAFERLIVMVQLEIAERLLAQPGSKEYGSLAVLVQSIADVESIRRPVSPAVFWPRPQVASAILAIRPNAAKRAQVGDLGRFREFLRDLYTQRRKVLRGALAGFPGRRRDKAQVDHLLAGLGIDGTRRAEELGLDEHLRLCAAFASN